MFPRVCACLFALSLVGFAQSGGDPGYRVYWWRADDCKLSADDVRRLAALGVTGVDAEGPSGVASARASALPFYVDHALPKGFLHLREADFQQARQAARSGQDGAGLVRRPCLRDPAAVLTAEKDLQATLAALGDATPDFLSLCDESSVTRSVNPLDTCRCATCLADLPTFLT